MRVPTFLRDFFTLWRLVVLAAIFFSMVQDSWLMNDEAGSLRTVPNTIVEVLGLVFFALTGFFPRVFGMAIILMWFVVSYFPDLTVLFGTVTCGTLMLAYFAFQEHYLLLGVSFMLVSVSDITTGNFNLLSSVFNIVGYGVTAAVGWTLGHYQRQAFGANREAEKIRLQASAAQAQLRHALAQDLHDSLAADLTRLTLITESLAKNSKADLALRESLDLISAQSREALADLRTTIHQLKTSVNTDAGPSTLNQVLQGSIKMARSTGINLELQFPQSPEEVFNRYEQITLAMLTTEATTNLMKYSRPGSTAEITVEVTGAGIEFMSTNEIGENKTNYALTSGLGLKQLSAYLRRRGGELEYVANAGMWLLHARIPRDLHEKMLNTSWSQKSLEEVSRNE